MGKNKTEEVSKTEETDFNAHEKGATENKWWDVNITCESQQSNIKWITEVMLQGGKTFSRGKLPQWGTPSETADNWHTVNDSEFDGILF